MIAALQHLRSEQGLPVHMPDSLTAFGINGGIKQGLAAHVHEPPTAGRADRRTASSRLTAWRRHGKGRSDRPFFVGALPAQDSVLRESIDSLFQPGYAVLNELPALTQNVLLLKHFEGPVRPQQRLHLIIGHRKRWAGLLRLVVVEGNRATPCNPAPEAY